MGTVIDFKEAGDRIRRRKMPFREQQILGAIERGDPVVFIDAEADAFVYPQYEQKPPYDPEAMAHWLGMPKPSAPSISHLGGIIEYDEMYFPPPSV